MDQWLLRGGSRILFRRGCTRLLLYFNTNKPEYQLYQKTAGHLMGGGGVCTPCTLPLDLPLLLTCRCCILSESNIFWVFSCSIYWGKIFLVGLIDQLYIFNQVAHYFSSVAVIFAQISCIKICLPKPHEKLVNDATMPVFMQFQKYLINKT